MSTKDLQAVHGKGNTRQVINRAIRAELPGGAELLDLIDALSGRKDFVTRSLLSIRQAMEKEIRRRYDMPQLDDRGENKS